MLEIRLLGGFSVKVDGRELALRSGRAQALLIYLLLERNSPQPRARVAELFWPETTDSQALTNLRRELLTLRRSLPEEERFLMVESRVLQWKSDAPAQLDLLGFEEAVALEDHERAVELYLGELVPGLHEEWLLPYRERYQNLYSLSLERCAEKREERGDYNGALTALRTLLSLDPLREELYRRMMGLCLRAGNRAQVESIFRDCSEVLERELDLEPDPETIAFYHRSLHDSPPPPLPRSSSRPPLVGRAKEWRVALRWLDEGLAEGSSSLLLVTGEPGIGKTRLLEELKAEMEGRNGTVLSGRGFEAEKIRAYGPWLDALKGSGLLSSGGSQEKVDRSELFDPVAAYLSGLAANRAVLLALDDLQWFDEASLALLHYVARSLSGSHVLISCSARIAELTGSPARRLVSALKRDGRLKEQALNSLEPEAVRSLLSYLNPSFPSQKAQACGGNPLFVVEMARGDGASGTLADVVSTRLDALDPPARELVSWGAVLGRSFTLETLSLVSARPLADLLEAVEILENQGLWSPMPEGYDFAHDVVREAAYRWLSVPRRRMLHLHSARRVKGAADRARHASLGGDAELAAEAYLEAAEESLRLLAFSEAAELARLGLAAGHDEEHPARALALLRTAVLAGMTSAELAAMVPRLERLTQHVGLRGVLEEEVLAGQVQSIVDYHLNRPEQLEASSLRVVEKARQADLLTAARMMAHSASCLACVGRNMPKTEAVALEARDLASRAGVELPDLEHALGVLAQFTGDWEAASTRLRRAVLLSRRSGEPWQICTCLCQLACLQLERGETAELPALVEEIRSIASPLKEESELLFADLLETLALERDPGEVLEALRRRDSKRMLAFGHRLQAQGCLRRGLLEQAEAHARSAWEAAEALGTPGEQVLCAAVMVALLLRREQRQAAHEWVRRMRKLPAARVGERALSELRRALGQEGGYYGNDRGRSRLAGAPDR